jgi:hypothetical protein
MVDLLSDVIQSKRSLSLLTSFIINPNPEPSRASRYCTKNQCQWTISEMCPIRDLNQGPSVGQKDFE